MGDLNDIIHPSEKCGPKPANQSRINYFCCMVKQCVAYFTQGYLVHLVE
jgi:hypothetical protein